MELINPAAFRAASQAFLIYLILSAFMFLCVVAIDKMGEKAPIVGAILLMVLTLVFMFTALYVGYAIIYSPSILW